MAGPPIRSDIVEVYIFRRLAERRSPEFLQMRRARGALSGTWQPVMGHIEEGESAPQTALRELAEETGFRPGPGMLGFWQLELVNTYYLASHESVVLSPGFAVEVTAGIEPVLDADHDAHRWVPRDRVGRMFLWPGQRAAIDHIVHDILSAGSEMLPFLTLDPARLDEPPQVEH